MLKRCSNQTKRAHQCAVLLVCLAFCLSICLSVRLSVSLPVCPSAQKKLQSLQLDNAQLLKTVYGGARMARDCKR